ncbi:MAG: ABC transporter ATP-binding protein [Lachnospiraceae bacterium]|nr:ABC transporter ATP-binding protein [Lachnospiraceae bacterium]
MKEILRVRDLNVFYKEKPNNKQVLYDVNFDIYEGETLGLVGESGCGKSTLSKAILGMADIVNGTIVNEDKHSQMIFQDPYGSLNPARTIGWILNEPLKNMTELDKDARKTEVLSMLKRVGLSEDYYDRKPSKLSGGQRQRISIAAALLAKPKLIIADEPVSALDVTIGRQIMDLMQELQDELKVSYLFISHDINVVYHMCDRLMVMKQGRIEEIGNRDDIFRNPKSEYTRQLIMTD